MSSPTSDRSKATALVMGLPRDKKSKEKTSSGLDIVPMDSLLTIVNKNLKTCEYCKGSQLKLVVDRRVAFATNWKLSCDSCDKLESTIENSVRYLKRKAESSMDFKVRRSAKKSLYKKEEMLRQKKERIKDRYIYSPTAEQTIISQSKTIGYI